MLRIRAVLWQQSRRLAARRPECPTARSIPARLWPNVASSVSSGPVRLPPVYLGRDLLLDEGRRSLRRGGQEVFLTPTEFGLLEALVAAEGAIVEDQALIAQIWGDGAAVAPQTLYAHLCTLRRKLGASGRIRRRYGVGYLLDPPGAGDGERP